MGRCLLNIDLGELSDEPDELYALAHVANIACGGHAGDEATMLQALQCCKRHGCAAGAHPSFPDRVNFGRAAMAMEPEHLRAVIAEQCERLVDLATRVGVQVTYMKPHGALYHAAQAEAHVAHAVIGGAVEALGYEIAVIGPEGGAFAVAAEAAGVPLLRERFADRATRPDGTLVPRSDPGAVIHDVATAEGLAREWLRLEAADSLCVHGDNPAAVAIARAVRALLDRRVS